MAASFGSMGLLAGCASDDDAVTVFPPYQYSYLNQLHLNIATLQMADHATPGSVPGDESGQAPIPPDQALIQMAQQRLVAAGTTGSAVFTIDRASIVHEPGGMLAGRLDTHLDVLSSTGQQVGEAEAHVTREMKPDLSKGDADSKANLYELTRQMMQDMNVELEFQIRHNLKDWLVDAGGMPTAGAIQTESLDGSSAKTGASSAATSSAVSAATPATTSASSPAPEVANSATPSPSSGTTATSTSATSAEPDAIFPGGVAGDTTDTSTTSTQKRSPASGYLKLPASKMTN
ncbi:hypothetical protein GOB81_10670 [Acetobacter sp. LMG 1627]|uniref:DUF4142 domain-containing protein n=2 Tax=Acetobacter conturbans TaxID=1737472 RepID=A0ABX0K528_9PROT|nr:hypothetical protein [Acetobacter conturbans]